VALVCGFSVALSLSHTRTHTHAHTHTHVPRLVFGQWFVNAGAASLFSCAVVEHDHTHLNTHTDCTQGAVLSKATDVRLKAC